FFLDIGKDLSAPVVKGVTGRHPLPDPAIMASTFESCGITAGTQVVAYDQSNGMYASRAWWLLNWLGHTDVAVLNGGFKAWMAAGFPVDNQWTPPAEGHITLTLRKELTVTKEEVAGHNFPLVDSREYKRFIGEIEPIDPVAGHIEGAVCMPYQDNVNEDGTWKSPDFLKQKFRELSSSTPEPVFYCGSGVTACHNILAYKIATGHNARLYGGSWSEWINYYPPVTGAK
ncbi:MAG TPA: sulfurtransferase, partial [Saprospiraceae bacterium]|nr:sulfurtransferase [Saprospiraceae bacterium]